MVFMSNPPSIFCFLIISLKTLAKPSSGVGGQNKTAWYGYTKTSSFFSSSLFFLSDRILWVCAMGKFHLYPSLVVFHVPLALFSLFLFFFLFAHCTDLAKGYDQKERTKKKIRKKTSWCKPYQAVLFCPPTPDGGLARVLREIIKKQKMNGRLDIKIMERSGIKIEKLLPGLKEEKDCGRKDCFIHTTGGKGSCNRESVVYKGTCLTCKENGKK